MKLSGERILTTHVGSLPRPKSLLELILAKEEGRPVDAAALPHNVIRRWRSISGCRSDCSRGLKFSSTAP